MTFTPEMGARIEALADGDSLYAATYIREVMEVHIIEQERRMFAADIGRRISLKARLREELIGLNENIMALGGKREQLITRIHGAEHGHESILEDESDEESEEEESFDEETWEDDSDPDQKEAARENE